MTALLALLLAGSFIAAWFGLGRLDNQLGDEDDLLACSATEAHPSHQRSTSTTSRASANSSSQSGRFSDAR